MHFVKISRRGKPANCRPEKRMEALFCQAEPSMPFTLRQGGAAQPQIGSGVNRAHLLPLY
jgi:hypothetical protein